MVCGKAKEIQGGSEPLPTSLRSATLPKGEGKGTSNTNLFGSRIFQSIVIPASSALVECGQGEGMLKHTNFFILSR